MRRRDFLVLAGTLVLAGSSVAAACRAAQQPAQAASEGQPNIVFIMADDLGYRHVGCYGQDRIRTPHIDRMAAEGLRFTSAYAGSSVCAPSRSSLLTGQHTGHTPVRSNSGGVPLPADAVTVAEVLRAAGYVTGAFGKWGLGDAGSEGAPNTQGFGAFLGPLHQVHAQYYWPEFLWSNEDVFPIPANRDGGKGQYGPDVMLNGALEFIRANRAHRFFLYFPSIVPHHEYQVPDEDLAQYAGKFPEPEPFIREDRGFEVQHQPAATMAAMITRFDRDVGTLLGELKAQGLDEKTLVIFTSDNGAAGGFVPIVEPFDPSGPLRGYKAELYEGGIRVPAIARWPGKIEAGATSDYPWALWDFLPTAAELADADVPAGVDGHSILPTLLGREQDRPAFLYWEMGSGNELKQAVRMGDWKAVRLKPDTPLELYDLTQDLGERRNVAREQPEVVARIEAYLKTSRHEPPALPESDWIRPAGLPTR